MVGENYMEKIVLFGASKSGEAALKLYGKENVAYFLDNSKAGEYFCGFEVKSLDDYITSNKKLQIVITTSKISEIKIQLEQHQIFNYKVFSGLFLSDNVPMSNHISHEKWPGYLKELVDFEGKEILEVGSRVVTGTNLRDNFKRANYTGFDIYQGPNVDIVGDAHKLTQYFDKKFDLIFSSAVFEHLAMPWIVADEMIKLLNPGGYIFVETHYSFSSHERPWHFFQFSEQALKVLFSEARGIKCIEAGVSNPIVGYFSEQSSEYLRDRPVKDLYCHSEFLGQKIEEVSDLSWNAHLVNNEYGLYPKM